LLKLQPNQNQLSIIPDIEGKVLLRKTVIPGKDRAIGKRTGVKDTPIKGDPHCLFLTLPGLFYAY
jgi:hypothetical protein